MDAEHTKINKQGWTSIRQARHCGHTCMNLRANASLNFTPEVLRLLHPSLSPVNKTPSSHSRIFQSQQANMNKRNYIVKCSITSAML